MSFRLSDRTPNVSFVHVSRKQKLHRGTSSRAVVLLDRRLSWATRREAATENTIWRRRRRAADQPRLSVPAEVSLSGTTKQEESKANNLIRSSSDHSLLKSLDAIANHPKISVNVSKTGVSNSERGSRSQLGKDEKETVRSPSLRESMVSQSCKAECMSDIQWQPNKPQEKTKKVAVVNLEEVELSHSIDLPRNSKVELSIQEIQSYRINKAKTRPFSAKVVKRVESKRQDISDAKAAKANAIRVQGSCIRNNVNEMPLSPTEGTLQTGGAFENPTEEEELSYEEEEEISWKARSKSLGSSDSMFEVDVSEPLLLESERAKMYDQTLDQQDISSPYSLDFFESADYQFLSPHDQTFNMSIFPEEDSVERARHSRVEGNQEDRDRESAGARQESSSPDVTYNLESEEARPSVEKQEQRNEFPGRDHNRPLPPLSNDGNQRAANMGYQSNVPFMGFDDPILSQVLQEAVQITSGNIAPDQTSQGNTVIHCTECGNRMLVDDAFFESKPVLVFKYSNFDAADMDYGESGTKDNQKLLITNEDESFEDRLDKICNSMENQINYILLKLTSLEEFHQPFRHVDGRRD
eukprot:749357-Hanusia_phi.AAC.7